MDHFNKGNCQFIDEDFVEAVEVDVLFGSSYNTALFVTYLSQKLTPLFRCQF